MTGVDQVLKLICASGGARSVVINGQLRADSGLVNTAVTAAAGKGTANLLVQGVCHSDFKAKLFAG